MFVCQIYVKKSCQKTAYSVHFIINCIIIYHRRLRHRRRHCLSSSLCEGSFATRHYTLAKPDELCSCYWPGMN